MGIAEAFGLTYEGAIALGSFLLVCGFVAALIAGGEESVPATAVSFLAVATAGMTLWGAGSGTGYVSTEVNMDRQTYILVGGPFSSPESDAKKLILVRVPQEGNYAFAVNSFPPQGYVLKKTNDGVTLLVPDENKKE